jgi:predicted alpha/beta superfamily hydrolase
MATKSTLMSRIPILILFLFFSIFSIAQHTVRFEIKSLPANHPPAAAIYLAGSFNGWNPQHDQFKFSQDDKGNYFFEIKLDAGNYEYKITRGGWDKVECKKSGAGIANRQLKVETNATVLLDIEEWQDRFKAAPVKSSAGKQVKVIDTAFFIPQLNRVRRVWLYLPEDYYESKRRWPVLYMHDGQNVFDDATSFSGEWGVDEFLDTTSLRSCIVVAIDNGQAKRLNEYSPYDFSPKNLGLSQKDTFSKGEGGMYVDFIVNTLKPFIDRNYRTLRKRDNTFIAGSSMGGLISMYALLKYPKKFGGAGVFSPAFWVTPSIFDEIRSRGKKVKAKIYFYAGKQEGETMVPLTMKAFETMSAISKSKMTTVIRDEGRHNEARWRVEFPLFYAWMMQ